jgi:HSP20 family molecular chaperone IbpA
MNKVVKKQELGLLGEIIDGWLKDWYDSKFCCLRGLTKDNTEPTMDFEEIDGQYVMETSFGPNSHNADIKVNVDSSDNMHFLEITSECEWEDDENGNTKTSSYSVISLPKDADPTTVVAKLNKKGVLKVTVQKLSVTETLKDDEKSIQVTNSKKRK